MKFVIYGRLDSLNDYVLACRSQRYAGASMKKRNENKINQAIIQALEAKEIKRVNKYPCMLKITWYEPNKRRDVDNIVFATKFILDALVNEGVLDNDSQKHVSGLAHDVKIDKLNPRIEVEIIERV